MLVLKVGLLNLQLMGKIFGHAPSRQKLGGNTNVNFNVH